MVVRSIFSVWFGFFVTVVITFMMTPMMISKLGAEKYGFWIFLQSFTGYFGLIDLGLRSGITQSVTRRIAKGDRTSLVNFISGILPLVIRTSLAVFGVISFVALIMSLTLKSDVIPGSEVFSIVFVQAVACGLTVLLFPFESVVAGCGRYDISVGISIPIRIVSALSLWGVLQVSSSLLALCLVFFCYSLIDQVLRCVASIILVPELKRVRPMSDSKMVSELYRVGGWAFVFQVSQNVLTSFNALLLGYWFTVSSLVPYNLASSLSDYLNKITVLASRVLFPEFVRIKHHFGIEKTRSLFHLSTRLGLAVSVVGLIGGWFWFDSFMGIWLREIEDSQQIIAVAKSMYLVFAAMNVVGAVRAIGSQLLGSEDQVDFLGKATLREAIFSVPCAILLGFFLGGIGLPLGNLLVLTVSTFCFVAPRYAKLLDESYAQFLFKICARPFAYGAIGCVLIAIWISQTSKIGSWFELFTIGFVPTLAIFGALLPVLLTWGEISSLLERLRKRGA